MIRTFVVLSSALLLSACVSPVSVIQPLDEKEAGIRNIQKVNVTYGELSKDMLIASDEKAKAEGIAANETDEIQYKSLKESMEEVVKLRLESRDNDSDQFANVDIEVDNLKLANPLMTVLIGDVDQLSGTARIYDPKTKEMLTEFYVDVLKGSGGLLGLAIRGGGVREKLGLQYADFIGDQLGFEKVETQAHSNNREE